MRALLAIAAALAVAMPGARAAEPSPGLWEHHARDGQGAHVSRACAKGRLDSPLQAVEHEGLTCVATDRSMSGGRIQVSAQCRDDAESASTLTITGAYQPRRVDLRIRRLGADGSVLDELSVRSRRISARCPLSGR